MQTEYLTVRISRAVKQAIRKLAEELCWSPSKVGAVLISLSLQKEMKMKIGDHVRQGDVLIRKIKSLPKGDRQVRKNGHILEGEATGHIHRVMELDQAEVLEIGSGLFMSVSDAGVSIVHEDHKTIELPVGNYKISRQREYSPEEIRNVAD